MRLCEIPYTACFQTVSGIAVQSRSLLLVSKVPFPLQTHGCCVLSNPLGDAFFSLTRSTPLSRVVLGIVVDIVRRPNGILYGRMGMSSDVKGTT